MGSQQHRYLPIAVALMAEQKKLDVGDHRFAKLLGISQPYWWRIRHGQRPATADFVRAAVLAFPHLAVSIAEIDAHAEERTMPTGAAAGTAGERRALAAYPRPHRREDPAAAGVPALARLVTSQGGGR